MADTDNTNTHLTKRTRHQVDAAVSHLGGIMHEHGASTITFSCSATEAVANIDHVLANTEASKGERVALFALRKALVAVALDKAGVPAEPEPEPAPAPSPAAVDASGAFHNRARRLEAAKAEAKTLGAWKATGATNGRPVTPNLDALEAERADKAARKPTGAKAVAKTPAASTEAPARQLSGSTRGQQARAIKREKGKRGAGRKMAPEAFLAYVANVRAEHPEDSRSDAMEYAYWVDGIAFSRAGWNKAWEAAEG